MKFIFLMFSIFLIGCASIDDTVTHKRSDDDIVFDKNIGFEGVTK